MLMEIFLKHNALKIKKPFQPEGLFTNSQNNPFLFQGIVFENLALIQFMNTRADVLI